MQSINNYILEKLKKIGINTQEKEYTDEELRKDYDKVWWATTKKEKQEVADKYGCSIIKIKDIQQEILKILKENRQNKKEFDDNDMKDFFRMEIPDKQWNKYLKEEPIEFVEYLYNYYDKKTKGIQHRYPSTLSIADRRSLKLLNIFKKYLKENK